MVAWLRVLFACSSFVFARAGPCEDAVAKVCPHKSGKACIACVREHKELKKKCNSYPHDPIQACGSSPGPSPGPSPSPSPSPAPTPLPPSPINPTTENCDSEASCSPTSFCKTVSNKACTFPDPEINMAKEIKSLGCRQCEQASASKHPICSTAALKKTLVLPSAVQAAFCNDEYLVIHSQGRPNHQTNLDGVPRPPGGSDKPYDKDCVTRSFVMQSQTFKIPLNYTLLEDGRKNKVEGQLPNVALPESGAVGVMINGVPIYPNEDNRGLTIQDACEADRCMAHVGRGADYHYHGDPFGHTCLYSDSNYTGSHPMLIGWGSDGPAIYGRYTSETQLGAKTELDDCGGHLHTDFSYHYHPNVMKRKSSGSSYDAPMISPMNCWKGNISKVKNFWMDPQQWRDFVIEVGKTENPGAPTQLNYDNSKTNPPYMPNKRSDAEQIKPCCTTSDYYAAPGVTLPINAEASDIRKSTSKNFEWTNDKITSCAREGRANGKPWLTKNNASYICTNAQMDMFYDPKNTLAFFLIDDGQTTPAELSCPNSAHTIQCFIFSSWGQVAGGPDACGDTCSKNMQEGSQSCCAKACTSNNFPEALNQSAKCSHNKWISGSSEKCGSKAGGGYCDCCPNCFDCVHPPGFANPQTNKNVKSLVENRFCDCRSGLDVSEDYTPCWNSCLDCFGDDGDVEYMPDDIAESCIGQSKCHLFVEASGGGSSSGGSYGYWKKCSSAKKSSCTDSSSQSGPLPMQPKAKGMAVCGASSQIVI